MLLPVLSKISYNTPSCLNEVYKSSLSALYFESWCPRTINVISNVPNTDTRAHITNRTLLNSNTGIKQIIIVFIHQTKFEILSLFPFTICFFGAISSTIIISEINFDLIASGITEISLKLMLTRSTMILAIQIF